MTWETLVLLLLAGIGAGLVGTVAGLASLVSYPALIAAGLAPVAANVTNTVSLFGIGIGGIIGSRPELSGQRARVRRLAIPSIAGGILGGVLLLLTPGDAFAKIVPWLIAFGSVAVLIRPRPKPLPGGDSAELPHDVAPHEQRIHDNWLWLVIFVISIYGGYFGAAAGVLMIAVLLLFTGEPLPRASAARTTLLFMANGIAALYFALFGPVHWPAAIAMGIGAAIGGRIGPIIVRHSPEKLIRIVIALAGIGLAIHLGREAY